jgi:ligand-binding SRPBCC domain-containing protein
MVVNVCPAAATTATPDEVWAILTTPTRFGEWADAEYVWSEPPGPIKPGQSVHLTARGLGRRWPVTIDVRDIDPRHRWLDLLVHLPFGVKNYNHITLGARPDGGTLVRFN